jgi:hypothetical protein
MAMSIPLTYNEIYGDTVVRVHLPSAVEVEHTYTKETSRGPITNTTTKDFPYLEILSGQTDIMLTSKNAILIDKLTSGSQFDYADAGHEKLVMAMLGDSPVKKKEIFVEAEVIEAEIVDEETDLSASDMRALSMPSLKKLAKSQGVKALPTMKKDELISAIIGDGEQSLEE